MRGKIGAKILIGLNLKNYLIIVIKFLVPVLNHLRYL